MVRRSSHKRKVSKQLFFDKPKPELNHSLTEQPQYDPIQNHLKSKCEESFSINYELNADQTPNAFTPFTKVNRNKNYLTASNVKQIKFQIENSKNSLSSGQELSILKNTLQSTNNNMFSDYSVYPDHISKIVDEFGNELSQEQVSQIKANMEEPNSLKSRVKTRTAKLQNSRLSPNIVMTKSNYQNTSVSELCNDEKFMKVFHSMKESISLITKQNQESHLTLNLADSENLNSFKKTTNRNVSIIKTNQINDFIDGDISFEQIKDLQKHLENLSFSQGKRASSFSEICELKSLLHNLINTKSKPNKMRI